MNKQQAVDIMLTGKKITHPSFDEGGYIFILNNMIYDKWFREMTIQAFIDEPYQEWRDNWFIISMPFVKPIPFNQYRKKLNKYLVIHH